MDDATVRKLNEINRQFYATVADEFDATRGQAWVGWERMMEYLYSSPPNPDVKDQPHPPTPSPGGEGEQNKSPLLFSERGFRGEVKSAASSLSVLDVGCGNGRFGVFLRDKLDSVTYHGMDNSPALLEHARTNLPDATLELRDIVEHPPDTGTYDLVALFGVLHHIPGADRRLSLMRTLGERVNPGGLLVFTAWRFYEYPRFRDRIVAWDADLHVEPNDYLLDWRRGERALRYCHYVNDAEADQLAAATGLTRVAQYRADGFTGDVNLYAIMKNINSPVST